MCRPRGRNICAQMNHSPAFWAEVETDLRGPYQGRVAVAAGQWQRPAHGSKFYRVAQRLGAFTTLTHRRFRDHNGDIEPEPSSLESHPLRMTAVPAVA